MCRQVEVMENDLLVLDAQLPDTAWGGARVSQGGVPGGPTQFHPSVPSPLCQLARLEGVRCSPTKPLLSPALGMAL